MQTGRRLRYLLLVLLTGILIVPSSAQEPYHYVAYDNIEFCYPVSLSSSIQIEMLDTVLHTPSRFIEEMYPRHIRFSFLDYPNGMSFEMPYPFLTPRIHVYGTDAIREFGQGFSAGYDALAALLSERPDLATYAGASVTQFETRLPFLPWVSQSQILRSHPEYIEIDGGTGIRYLTVYTMGYDLITDRRVFYTFQGIAADGRAYISAILPVKTDVLPEFADATSIDTDTFSANYDQYLTDVVAQLSVLPDEAFSPSLTTLDALVGSIVVDPDVDLEPTIDSPNC